MYNPKLNYNTMKRLDQGHLHPELKVLKLTFPDQESNPSHRGRKDPLEQLVNIHSEHLLMTYILTYSKDMR